MAFVQVSTEAILKGRVRKEFAWNMIVDYSRYPAIMESVDEVRINQRDEREGKSEWFVTVEEAPLSWVERDYFDKANYHVRFESIAGDFEALKGDWRVEDCPDGGIKINFNIEYNLGIPVIEEVLGHILKEKMKSNIDSMLHAIKEELDKTQVEQRRFPRIRIGKYSNFLINGRGLRCYVANISAKGMLFYYEEAFDASQAVFEIGPYKIIAEQLFNDIKHKNARVIFKDALAARDFDDLVNLLK